MKLDLSFPAPLEMRAWVFKDEIWALHSPTPEHLLMLLTSESKVHMDLSDGRKLSEVWRSGKAYLISSVYSTKDKVFSCPW